ncbi:hypothetical protein C8R44DRAFT_213970 [Mycena epipterygia]|nr:hypothetical protein C8R44DRAFT_213970 [Mycena epipterygia]
MINNGQSEVTCPNWATLSLCGFLASAKYSLSLTLIASSFETPRYATEIHANRVLNGLLALCFLAQSRFHVRASAGRHGRQSAVRRRSRRGEWHSRRCHPSLLRFGRLSLPPNDPFVRLPFFQEHVRLSSASARHSEQQRIQGRQIHCAPPRGKQCCREAPPALLPSRTGKLPLRKSRWNRFRVSRGGQVSDSWSQGDDGGLPPRHQISGAGACVFAIACHRGLEDVAKAAAIACIGNPLPKGSLIPEFELISAQKLVNLQSFLSDCNDEARHAARRYTQAIHPRELDEDHGREYGSVWWVQNGHVDGCGVQYDGGRDWGEPSCWPAEWFCLHMKRVGERLAARPLKLVAIEAVLDTTDVLENISKCKKCATVSNLRGAASELGEKVDAINRMRLQQTTFC